MTATLATRLPKALARYTPTPGAAGKRLASVPIDQDTIIASRPAAGIDRMATFGPATPKSAASIAKALEPSAMPTLIETYVAKSTIVFVRLAMIALLSLPVRAARAA